MWPRMTHLAMHVTNLDACIAFYERYCGMRVCHRRHGGAIVWMAEPGRETDFVFVMMSGGHRVSLPQGDYRHLGFAVESRQRVDDLAALARADGCLLWEPREEPFPVGYYCGIIDPEGQQVEFSYGQPLGPGAEGMTLEAQ